MDSRLRARQPAHRQNTASEHASPAEIPAFRTCYNCETKPFCEFLVTCPHHSCCPDCLDLRIARAVRRHAWSARLCCEQQEFCFRDPKWRFLFGGRDFRREYFSRQRAKPWKSRDDGVGTEEEPSVSDSESEKSVESSRSFVEASITMESIPLESSGVVSCSNTTSSRQVALSPQPTVAPTIMTVTTQTITMVRTIKWMPEDFKPSDAEKEIAEAVQRVAFIKMFRMLVEEVATTRTMRCYLQCSSWLRTHTPAFFKRPLKSWHIGGSG